jgi:long-chain acyl-CoA synthetase
LEEHHDKKPWLGTYPIWLPKTLPLPDESVLDRFENSYLKYPDEPCIYYFDTVLSYKNIHNMAFSLSATLEKMGVTKGDRVVLWMQNIPQVAIASLAAWIKGAVIVPANPMYTVKDLQYLIKDCSPKIIFCQDELYHPAISDNLQVITTSPLDLLNKNIEIPEQLQEINDYNSHGALNFLSLIQNPENVHVDPVKPKPLDLAYLVYTSGTTGPPKGAMISHANIVYNCRVYETAIRLDRNDKVLGVAPLFHITGIVAHLAVAFHLGIPLILFNRFHVPDVLHLIQNYQATFTVASITVYIALLNHPEAKKFNLSSLIKAYSGGAPVSPSTVQKFKDILGLTIFNVYGLTESTSPATITPIGLIGPVDADSGALSVGLIIPGLEAWIVDVDDPEKILPTGETGELVIQGPSITNGYWNKPEETAHAIKNGRFYTGDVAKIDEKGWCFIVDRKKDQINVSGYKVWPRDVEDVLYQHPGVKEAAVIGIPDPYRGETVKAFVSLSDAYRGKVTREELIVFCKGRMAAFKYPRFIDIIDEVPKTPTGKFLRRVLKKNP